jgi:hydroxymethylbilane synthase
MLPAPGQGALGIECLASQAEVAALLAPLAHAGTASCVRAERAVSRALGGSCALPLGAYAELQAGRLRLRTLIASADGRRVLRTDGTGDISDPEGLGNRAADELRRQGAEKLLGS